MLTNSRIVEDAIKLVEAIRDRKEKNVMIQLPQRSVKKQDDNTTTKTVNQVF